MQPRKGETRWKSWWKSWCVHGVSTEMQHPLFLESAHILNEPPDSSWHQGQALNWQFRLTGVLHKVHTFVPTSRFYISFPRLQLVVLRFFLPTRWQATTAFFLFEALLKMFSYGLFKHKTSYFRDHWFSLSLALFRPLSPRSQEAWE